MYGSDSSEAAVRATLSRVGDRWTLHVVRALDEGPKRFNQLKRKVRDISSRMLTLTLKNLERDGIVVRTVTGAGPPTIDYRLTELGITFLDPVIRLASWIDDHRSEIATARTLYDAKSRTSRRSSEPKC